MVGPIVLALLPVMLLIALGKLLRGRVFTADVFWRETERLGYYLLLPGLIVHTLATANWGNAPVGRLMLTLTLSTILVALLLVALRRWMPVSDAAFSSVFQGGVRFNNYVGLPAAAALYGPEGLALGALASAAIVPTANILCVLMFARYGHARPNFRGVLLQLAKNPLLVASLIGLFLNLSGLGLPPGIEPVLKALGQASLPIGLLCVGAALTFASPKTLLAPTLLSMAAKFGLLPLTAVGLGLALGLTGPSAGIVLLYQTLPTASASYILARQMGGDAPLMAVIISAQTVLAAAVLPLVLAFGKASLGM